MKLCNISINNFKSIKKIELTFQDMLAMVGKNNVGKSNIIEAIKLCLEPVPIDQDCIWINAEGIDHNMKIELKFKLDDTEKDDFALCAIDDHITIQISADREKLITSDRASTPKQKVLALLPNEEWLNYTNINKQIIKKFTKKSLKIGDKVFIKNNDPKTWIKNSKSFLKNIMHDTEYKKLMTFDYVDIDKVDDNLHDKLAKIIYIPAVKYVTDELKITEKSSLMKLLNLFISSISDQENKEIEKMINELNNQLKPTSPIFLSVSSTINKSMKEIFSDCTVDINVNLIEKLPDLIKNMAVVVNDGFKEDSIINKGTGLQRMLIFAILRSYAKQIKKIKEKKSTIFLIEEPEVYLHPHAQRSLYETLIDIKNVDQIIYSTHSNLFINIEYYQEICIIRKINGETIIKQHTKPYEENPFTTKNFEESLNEGFFADKIILVEGITDEIYLTAYHKFKNLQRLSIRNISLIHCNGLSSIIKYLEIYTAFDIDCYPIIDSDKKIKDTFMQRFNISAIPEKSTAYDNGAIFFLKIEKEIHTMLTKKILIEFSRFKKFNQDKLSNMLKDFDEFYGAIHTNRHDYKHEFALFFSKIVSKNPDTKFPNIFKEIFQQLNIKN